MHSGKRLRGVLDEPLGLLDRVKRHLNPSFGCALRIGRSRMIASHLDGSSVFAGRRGTKGWRCLATL